MRARSPWAVSRVKKKIVSRELGVSRTTEHSKEETVMDTDKGVKVVDIDAIVTVVVGDTMVEHMDIVRVRLGEAPIHLQVAAVVWRDRT